MEIASAIDAVCVKHNVPEEIQRDEISAFI